MLSTANGLIDCGLVDKQAAAQQIAREALVDLVGGCWCACRPLRRLNQLGPMGALLSSLGTLWVVDHGRGPGRSAGTRGSDSQG